MKNLATLITLLTLSTGFTPANAADCDQSVIRKAKTFLRALTEKEFSGTGVFKWKNQRGKIETDTDDVSFYLQEDGENSWMNSGCNYDEETGEYEEFEETFEIIGGCLQVNGEKVNVEKATAKELAFSTKSVRDTSKTSIRIGPDGTMTKASTYHKNGKWDQSYYFRGKQDP